MKILEKNEGLLTNSEVAEVLRSRGADSNAPTSRARPSERVALRYLEQQPSRPLSREAAAAFRDALKPFNLTRAEALQVLNLAPLTEVEVLLAVPDADARLGDAKVAELAAVVAAHAARSVDDSGGGGGDGEAATNGG